MYGVTSSFSLILIEVRDQVFKRVAPRSLPPEVVSKKVVILANGAPKEPVTPEVTAMVIYGSVGVEATTPVNTVVSGWTARKNESGERVAIMV